MKRYLVMLGLSLLLASPVGAWAADQLKNINTATNSQLTEVKGVGEKTAAAIVAYRKKQGSIKSMDELLNVKGVGKKTLEKIKATFTVSKKSASASSTSPAKKAPH